MKTLKALVVFVLLVFIGFIYWQPVKEKFFTTGYRAVVTLYEKEWVKIDLYSPQGNSQTIFVQKWAKEK